MPIDFDSIRMGASSQSSGGYVIPQSIRFNDDDSAYMYRIPSVAGNRKTWTWSGWVKRGNLSNGVLFEPYSDVNNRTTFHLTYDILNFDHRTTAGGLLMSYDATAVLRDPSAWYHIVLAVDTTEAVSTDSVKISVNGVLWSLTEATATTQNIDTWANSTVTHYISKYGGGGGWDVDGYLSEIHFVDGAALTASSFGEFDANGVWVPKEFAADNATVDQIPYSTYSALIGDMDGLTADLIHAFDGTVDGALADMAYIAATVGYVGKDWGSGVTKDIVAYTVKGPAAGGGGTFSGGSGGTHDLYLYGSNSAPTNSTDGTLLDTNTGVDTGTAPVVVRNTTDASGSYRYHWVRISNSFAEAWISEIEFFEAGTGYGTNGFHIDGADSADLGFNANVDADTTYNPGSAAFDGTNDYITRGAELTGNGNGKSGIFNVWVKFNTDGTAQTFWGVQNDSIDIKRDAANKIWIYINTGSVSLITTSSVVAADGWTHILGSWDVATGYSDIYINDVQETLTTDTTTDTTLDYTHTNHWFFANRLAAAKLNGEVSDMYINLATSLDLTTESNRRKFISSDLTPVDLGSDGSTPTGSAPIVFFHINRTEAVANFAGNEGGGGACSITGALDKGSDATGRHYTTSGLTSADQMLDSPTDDAANGVSNFPTMSPLDGAGTLSNGNMDCYLSSWPVRHYAGWDWPTSGKWYIEVTGVTGTYFNSNFGGSPRKNGRGLMDATSVDEWYCGFRDNDGWLARIYGSASVYGNQSSGSAWDMNVGVVMGLAFDADNNTFWMSRNGVWLYFNGTSASSATVLAQCEAGTFENVPFISTLIGAPNMGIVQGQSSAESTTYTWNFGQAGFAYALPTGFKALCTANLPAPAIADGSAHFETLLYTGNGSATQRTDIAFNTLSQPDFVWIKQRSSTQDHALHDSVRGVPEKLESNNTGAAVGGSGFGSDGFGPNGVGSELRIFTADAQYNASGATYVAWGWKAGGTAVSNTDGSITSSVSANTTAGFSIMTYTGTNANATIGHGLTQAPELVIAKNRVNSPRSWIVYHESIGATKYLRLDGSNAAAISSTTWNDTAPTSTVIHLGAGGETNEVVNMVCYAWHSVPGMSQFGTYEGNANTDGAFVHLGFAPEFVMVKSIDSTSPWHMFDNLRTGSNVNNDAQQADAAAADLTTDLVDLLSNGFKCRISTDPNVAETYVYAAFAEHPFGGDGVAQARAR